MTQRQPYIFHSSADVFMIGGASILFFILFYFFVPSHSENHSLGWTMYYLSFVCNYPHFMMSYQILYGDLKDFLFEKKRYIWAGLVVPSLIISGFVWSYTQNSVGGMGAMVHLMFLTVGWHYVRQVYGMVVVPAAKAQFHFAPWLRRSLLANLYSLWGLSYASGNYVPREAQFYGVKYQLWGFSKNWVTVAYVSTAVTLIWFLFLLSREWVRSGKKLPKLSWVGFLSLYVWYLPFMYHRQFFLMVPFFHSLQYILFVLALKRNQAEERFLASDHPDRGGFLRHLVTYFGGSVVLGFLSFYYIPKWADQTFLTDDKKTLFGATPFTAMAHLFINIHHYFIDNVIWRKDTPNLKV